jgi:PAS domain S-box-containing protein
MNEELKDGFRTRVLVIEDDHLQSALVRKKLELNSFEVSTCADIEAGLQLVQMHDFAVAVLDLDLGGQSGFDFVRELTKLNSKTKVVVHSFDVSFKTVKEGLNLGVFAYVEKGRLDNELIDFCRRAESAYLSERLDAANRSIAFQLRLLEVVEHGVIATDRTGRITYWNGFSERLTHLKASEVLGRCVHDVLLLSPQDLPAVQNAIVTGTSVECECQFLRSTPQPILIPLRLVVVALYDLEGVQMGSVISHHDLTSTKANEQKLNFHSSLLAVNSDIGQKATESQDPRNLFQQVILKILDVLTLSFGHVTLRNLSSDELDLIVCIGDESKSKARGLPISDVENIQVAESMAGFRMPFYESGTLLGCIEGEFETPMIASVEILTFLKSVSRILAGVLRRDRATRLWKSLFENSLDAILIITDDSKIADVNTEACTLLGYSREEFLGLPVDILVASDSHPVLRKGLERLQAHGKLRSEIELVGKDRTAIVAEVIAITNILPNTHMASFRDITEQRKLEKRISNQESQLNHLQRSETMGEMAAVLAHEINQPLGAIANYSGGLVYELKTANSDNTELCDTLNRICDESLKAGDIVNRLRKFISPVAFAMSKVSLNLIIQDTVKLLRNLLSNASVTLELDLDPKLPNVEAEPIRIQQVLVNVMKNSAEALDKNDRGDRRIKVSTKVDGDVAQILIVDNGPSMSPDDFAKIFKPYHTTKANGLGMGLCISRSIMEQHHGKLIMEPSVPNGMLTIVSLPISVG